MAPVADRFCMVALKVCDSCVKMIGYFGALKLPMPAVKALLKGDSWRLQSMLVVSWASKTARAWAICVSWIAGS